MAEQLIMATLIDWSQIETKLQAYERNYDCECRSVALAMLFLEYTFGIAPDEARDDITDGPQDRGIDAVVLERKGTRETIHLVNIRTVSDFEKSDHNYPSTEIDKMLAFLADLLAKSPALKESVNPLLWQRVEEIWSAYERGTPAIVLHLCGNMGPLTSTERSRFEASVTPYRYVEIRQHTAASLALLLIEHERPVINASLRLVDKQYFERSDGNIRGLIATIEALELIKLIQDPDDPTSVRLDIFEDNVRIYQTSKNRINKAIIDSALSEENSNFWYLNNGLTITCDSFEYPPGTRGPTVTLTNVQIVNGGQTSNALFEAYRAKPDKLDNVLLLARIYETRQQAISRKVAESTNSQIPINSRDLHSNDEIQKRLQGSFRDMGYFYERKTGEFKEEDRTRRIDAFLAGQCFLAYYDDRPEVAYKDKARVFGDLYDSIFNEELTAANILAAVSLYRPISDKKRELQSAIRRECPYDAEMLFLLEGGFHVLYTIGLLAEAGGCDLGSLRPEDRLVERAIAIVKATVDREAHADPGFSTGRFFKDATTKRKIHATLSEENGERAGNMQGELPLRLG